MFRKLFFVIMACLLSMAVHAQYRNITRGAVEGELYYNANWYCKYDYNFNDTLYLAILHLTENGKKAEIQYSAVYIEPTTAITEYPMSPNALIADATSGVLYNHDFYCSHDAYWYDRLWVSFDYGKNWELRDEPEYTSYYYTANVEGVIYRGTEGVEILKSTDYGATFMHVDGICWTHSEFGWQEEEVFMIGVFSGYDLKLFHTYDLFQTYLEIPIDEEFMFGQIGGIFPDVFRGGLPGEVYITSRFPDNIFKISFSADTGYHFRVVHQREKHTNFMSDRKAGDFYIVTEQPIETNTPWGWYTRLCIEYYQDYGETLAGTYCHDLTAQGVVSAVKEWEEEREVVVYPNPTTGALHVTSDALQVTNIEVFDIYGKRHASHVTRNENIIDISDLQGGIYFVKITTNKGIVTKKIIKK